MRSVWRSTGGPAPCRTSVGSDAQLASPASAPPMIEVSMMISPSGTHVASTRFEIAVGNTANAHPPNHRLREAAPPDSSAPVPSVSGPHGTASAIPSLASADVGQQVADVMTSSGLYAANARSTAVESRMIGWLVDERA